jgi:hypothetical protein
MKTTRTRKTSGSKQIVFASAAALALCLSVSPVLGQSKAKDKPHATLAGTVFRDPGFAQPGATVTIALKAQPEKKLQQQTSSPRGEFAFRVPPGPASYIITATLKGFKPDRQDFDVSGEEQINATMLLVSESKK